MPVSYSFDKEVETLTNIIKSQFKARTSIEGNSSGKDFKNATLTTSVMDNVLWFTMTTDDETHNITIPIPFVEDGVIKIKFNEVERAICNHLDVPTDRVITYLNAVQQIFIGDYSGLVKTVPVKKTIFIQSLAYSILNSNSSVIIYNLQKAINELVNKMPLHETLLNSWMMNNRLILIDPVFETLDNPEDKLNYHIEKNNKYYDRGWTSIGLSDGSLVDKNYILVQDIRKYTVFGLHHHNPQRNLYSTLGMKGDELPLLRSSSAQELIDNGITRKGWNLFTAFVDIPDTFEDQIMVDVRHADKYIKSTRRFQCFGEILVKKNQSLKLGTILSQTKDGKVNTFKVKADHAYVKRITKGAVSVGGVRKEVHNIIVVLHRKLKDGTKFTNTHGNKGIIRLTALGTAIDPTTGKERKLDVIVSAKSIKKRKNHGQILEMLFNNLYERQITKSLPKFSTSSIWNKDGVGIVGSLRSVRTTRKPVVLKDDYTLENLSTITADLKQYNFNDACTWRCNTYAGEVTAVCGTIFWGVSKDVEDQIWAKDATTCTNSKNVRTAGLKFSTVEFKALETRFGENNAIMEEVLSYSQGIGNINESIKILRSKKFELPSGLPIKTVAELKNIDQSNGTIFTEETLKNTIADENYMPDGFILQLPVAYQTAVGHKHDETYEGPVTLQPDSVNWERYKALYVTSQLYVPIGLLRCSWRHDSGLYGMNEIAVLLNNIITFAKRHIEEPEEVRHYRMLYSAIGNYYMRVATSISTKRGDISNYGMSVRYPYSAKAVASLSNDLPANTVQIHKDMAKILNVSTGDIVLTERFPCLGFMGVRPQQVDVTNDIMCKYTIRVSGNSLVSQNLDFDGDVLYIAAFHTKEAKAELRQEWTTPNESCWKYIDYLNNRKGTPAINQLGLMDYEIIPFKTLTKEQQSTIVGKLTGVKAQTGPVIALAYNLMRIMENSNIEMNTEIKAGIEMFIEKAGQSVFEQKHGGVSLCNIVIEAICTGDTQTLINEGFDPYVVHLICNTVAQKAIKIGIRDLKHFHEKVGKSGSNVINRIVRKENKIYFASRSNLEACALLEYLTASVVDLPSKIFNLVLSGKYQNIKTVLDIDIDNKLINKLKDVKFKDVCLKLFKCIDKLTGIVPNINRKGELFYGS